MTPETLGWGYDVVATPAFDEDAYARGRKRRRRVLVLGVVALLVAALAGLTAVWAEFTASLSSFGGDEIAPEYRAAKAAGLVAVTLAAWSLATAIRIRRDGGAAHIGRSVPALLALGAVAWGWHALDAEGSVLPPAPPAERPVAADAAPEVVVVSALGALNWERYDDFCLLLAERARGRRCAESELLAEAGFYPVYGERVAYRSPDEVLVRFYASLQLTERAADRYRVRLVREPEGWQLLDVPGRHDRCVDLGPDPWSCPVTVVEVP